MTDTIKILLFSTALACAGAEPDFPRLTEIPASLRLPAGAALAVGADGSYLVDGKPRFLLGMQVNHNYLADLLPTSGYPASLRWIYEQPLNYERAQRLGFDTIAVFNLPGFLQRYRPDFQLPVLRRENIALNRETWGAGLPLYVDFTCFPWTNGALADHKQLKGTLPEEAVNQFRNGSGNHWMPYNVNHPAGRAAYRAYWREGTQFALRNGSPVVAYEIFNEPAYDDPGPYNRKLFQKFLREKYGDIERLNAVYRAAYPSFEKAAAFRHKAENPALFVDWSKFMEHSFVELCRLGRDTITELDPDARVTLQSLGRNSYRVLPQSNVNLYEISKVLNAVTTPTGGSAKVSGLLTAPARESVATPDSGRGEGFLSRHFLRAIADGKPIHNSEAYTGKNGRETFYTIWRDLLLGSNATYLFEWSKRAWDFHPAGSAEGGRKVAERYPWMILNPYAYAPAELTSFLKAKEEIFRFAEFFVPRERNIPREVALLISFPSERYGVATGRVAKNDIATFASALEFSHYPIDVILEEQLPENRASRYRMILAAGVSNTYPATVGKLREFVEAGGILLLTREFMQEDEYGNPNRAWGDLFSLEYRDAPEALPREIELDIPQAKLLPGRIVGRNVREILAAPSWEKLAASGPHPVLLRRPLGKGFLYLLTATMQDYAAAAIVGGILQHHGIQPAAELTRLPEGDLAANVELHIARRGERTACFLFNHDLFAKAIALQLPAGSAAFDLTGKHRLPISGRKAALLLPPLSRAIIGIGREESFAAEFGPFQPLSEQEILAQQKKINRELAEKHAAKLRQFLTYQPNPALTRPLDLRSFCNRGFIDRVPGDGRGGWTDQGAENALVGVPWGVQHIRGVPCDIIRFDENEDRTCIVLASDNQTGKLPEAVRGIPVNGKVKALYFFHAAAWATRGREALTYRLHRADGSSLDIPVRCETEIWDWWITPGNPHVAWSNLASRGFYLWRWENPEPEKEILRLDLLSARNEVTAMVVAITAEYCDTESNIRRCPFRMAAAWGFDTGLKKHPDGRLEVVVSERSKPWSGIFVPFSGKLRDEERDRGRIRFRIRGGCDRFGDPKGGQKLQFHLVRRDPESKKIRRLTRTVELERFFPPPGRLSADFFLDVTIPLDRLRWKEARLSDVNAMCLQFRGEGQASGIVLENVRFEFESNPTTRQEKTR